MRKKVSRSQFHIAVEPKSNHQMLRHTHQQTKRNLSSHFIALKLLIHFRQTSEQFGQQISQVSDSNIWCC